MKTRITQRAPVPFGYATQRAFKYEAEYHLHVVLVVDQLQHFLCADVYTLTLSRQGSFVSLVSSSLR